MKIDIWSDIQCPFCYIGKRKFEAGLSKFAHKDKIELVWHSFQLDPELQTDPEANIYEYLAERKGQSLEWSEQIHKHVAGTAKEVGLEYNFDKAIVANSFNAHRLIQLAKKHGLGDIAEETLFRSYFTDGKNIDDAKTLIEIGKDIGISENEVAELFSSDVYKAEVLKDFTTAREIGIRGVPFFVLNNKYAVSGAQPPETFTQALDQAWKEFETQNQLTPLADSDGETCGVDGNC